MSATLSNNAPRILATPTAGEIAGEKTMLLAFWVTGFLALAVGIAIGVLQSSNYAGINLYPYLQPFLKSYYQGLTMHGVLNAYVFTFFTISGWLMYLPARELKLKPNMGLAWFTYALMLIGTLMAAYGMFDNSSSVLYTMYAPLKGSAWFYLGITLVVVASILPLFVVLEMRARWKRANPGQLTPLVTYMSATTLLMWLLAALGAGTEAVFLLDPWSLGMTQTIDPLLARTLFWWTGHPIVYFWLMPGYVSIYALLPRQAGGKLISDPLARLAFLLLFVFSLPVGTHHQYTDPGISPVIKGIVTALTLSVAIPSLHHRAQPGIRRSSSRRQRADGLVDGLALERPLGGRAGSGAGEFHLRRSRGHRQRQLAARQRGAQHPVDSGALSPHRGHHDHPCLHGRKFLAAAAPDRPQTLQLETCPLERVAVVPRPDDLGLRRTLGRHGRRAASRLGLVLAA